MNYNTALVTGASRGIGRAVAVALAKQGYNIALNYLKNDEAARETKKIIEETGVKCVPVKADVSNYDEVSAMVENIRNELGGICVLVNNAGIAQQKMFNDITPKDWETMMGSDLNSVFYCCKAVLDDMIHCKRGKIINITSMWGLVGASCEVHYSAAKAGVIGLTKALAKELGPSGIQVNAVAPGVIDTQMNENLSEQTVDELREETPLMRIGVPQDIADTVAFLASEKSDFITGQIISVNGGFVIN